MGRVIATAMNGNRQTTRNPGKNEYNNDDQVRSPTSSQSSNPESTNTEIYDNQQTELDPHPMAKKYCCSNSPQSECKVWSIFDIITACLVLIVQLYFTLTLKVDRQLLQNIVDSDQDNEKDLNRFLQYSPLKQDLILTVVITREIISVLLGILLYASANMRVCQQLRIWLGSTFVAIVVDLFLFIPKMAFTQNKFLFVSGMIAYFLYKWYEVWIVTVLFKEIKQEEAESKLVGDVHRTIEPDGDTDKPPDVSTITSGTGHFNRHMGTGVGKTYPSVPMSQVGLIGNMASFSTTENSTYSRMGAGKDSSITGRGYNSQLPGSDTPVLGSIGWEPDPMGSTSTFILAQPPKRLKFQSRPTDLTMVDARSPMQLDTFSSSRY